MTAGDSLLNAVIFVLALNCLMFMVGGGIVAVGGANPFQYEDNALRLFNAGNSSNPDVPSEPGALLPSGVQSISPDTGTYFTDIFNSARNWFFDITGLGWILAILSSPKIILGLMGLGSSLAWAITALWYGVTILIIASYMFGR